MTPEIFKAICENMDCRAVLRDAFRGLLDTLVYSDIHGYIESNGSLTLRHLNLWNNLSERNKHTPAIAIHYALKNGLPLSGLSFYNESNRYADDTMTNAVREPFENGVAHVYDALILCDQKTLFHDLILMAISRDVLEKENAPAWFRMPGSVHSEDLEGWGVWS